MDGKTDLFQVVDALHAPCHLARRLDSRQEQGDQDRDNRDHDQEFNQGKTTTRAVSRHCMVPFIFLALADMPIKTHLHRAPAGTDCETAQDLVKHWPQT